MAPKPPPPTEAADVTRWSPVSGGGLALSKGQDANDEENLAESEGFEPPIPLRVLLISNQVPSAARPALQNRSTL